MAKNPPSKRLARKASGPGEYRSLAARKPSGGSAPDRGAASSPPNGAPPIDKRPITVEVKVQLQAVAIPEDVGGYEW